MEQAVVHDVTLEFGIERISVTGPAGGQARIFRALADAGVATGMVLQRVLRPSGLTELSFTVDGPQEADRALGALRDGGPHTGGLSARRDAPVARISLLGAGMRSDPGLCASFYEAVSRAGTAFGLTSASATRISAVLPETDVVECAQAVRTLFGLVPEHEWALAG